MPLPWTAGGTSFGFGDGEAHLPQPAWFAQYAVSTQDGVAGSTLELYRSALELRRAMQSEETLEWIKSADNVLHFIRPNGWQSVTNFGTGPVELPAGTVVVSSSPLTDGKLPADTTAWII
ncbi:glycosidase [Arthrobacter sp. GAS37]